MTFTSRYGKRLVDIIFKNQLLIKKNYCNTLCSMASVGETGVTLRKVIEELNEIAPLKYAENWDNVGLLIEPFTPKPIRTIFLTNDLTEPVLKEALDHKTDLIISYHPPIFAPLKQIRQSNWKERIVSICLENRIAVYSPHTSWDFCRNGVNDWLASAIPHINSEPIEKPYDAEGGMGRFLILRPGITLMNAIDRIKNITKLKDLRVAYGINANLNTELKTVGICAGSGTTILRKIHADLYITGEMSHHEILNATQNNISIILCNHSNSERGYLEQFKIILKGVLDNVNIIVSKIDSDPLVTV